MMEFKVETVTPEIAAKYLKRNVDNYRKISKNKVRLYAEEMKAGKWQLNGEGIMFDETGRLKNGQHRLAAVLMAGVPVEMTVVRGVSDDINIYDVGANRTAVQIANASGYDNHKEDTSVATVIVGNFGPASKGKLLAWLGDHSGDLARAYRVSGANNKGLGRRMASILACYLALRYDLAKAYELEVFYRILSSGNTVGSDGYEPSPALVARRMLESRYQGSGGRRAQREQAEILLMAIADFHRKKTRQMNYQITEPLKVTELVDRVRKEDGLRE